MFLLVPAYPGCPGSKAVKRSYLWRQQTDVPGLSCAVICVILYLTVLVELRLMTDGQRDRQTKGHGAIAHITLT